MNSAAPPGRGRDGANPGLSPGANFGQALRANSGNDFVSELISHETRSFVEMSARERLAACSQHATIRHLSDEFVTNKSLRERLKMSERQRSVV